MMGRKNTTADFWRKVNLSGECWMWTSGVSPKGYGLFTIAGKTHRANRYAWELENGPVPSSMLVCHNCDTPGCCRPSHLYLGTAADNQADKVAKGRQLKGDNHPMHLHPEYRARGDRHGSHTHPERWARGDRHWRHRKVAV